MSRCRRRRWPWVLLVVLFLSCCGEDDPWSHGEVTAREFQPAHTIHHAGYYTDGGETCIHYGDDWWEKICIDNPDLWHPPHDDHIPDRWRIRVAENSDGHDSTTEYHWIWVHEATYDGCDIGRRYDRAATECVLA